MQHRTDKTLSRNKVYMPEYIKALIVILVLATAIFAVAKQPVSTIIKTKDFTRRRNLWLALAFAAFLTNDFWLYTLIAILLLTFVHRYEANPPALFFFILFALPPGTVPIPGMGIINFIFDLSHVRILELFILLPAFFALNRKSDTAPIGRVVPDKFIVAYLLLTALLNVRDTSVLDALRQAFYLFIGGFLPYFVLSRSLKNLHAFKDTLVSLVLAIMVLGLIAVIETYKHWLLYQPLIDTLKITGTQQYLGRDGMLRAVASAQHPIVLGYLMVVGMGSYLFLKRSIHHKLIRWLGMMLLVAGLISSLSRGPWIGAAVLLLVFVATGRKPARRLTVLVLASVLALPLVAILPGGEKIINLLPFFGTKAVAPINYRENLFTASMIVIQKYPWLGSANFAKTPEMQPLITEGMVDLVNTYVGVALNSGFVGLGLFVGFFASTLSGVYRSMRSISDKDSDEYLLGQALLATQLSIMVIIATTSSISFISILNWAVAGLGVAYSQMVRSGLANSVNSKYNLIAHNGLEPSPYQVRG
jgi:O-antigen ligase